LTSFFAHFVLFRRLTEQELDVELANAVIQAYLDVLQNGQMDALVATYAAELREGTAEDSYAGFLRCGYHIPLPGIRADCPRSNQP
jgi:hypothetical protein